MEDLINRIQTLLAGDAVDEALALARAEQERYPAGCETGLAAVAAHRRDAIGCLEHATRAHELAPGEALPLEFLAVGCLLRKDAAAAETWAKKAVEVGGGRRSLGGLANMLLGSRKPAEAEAIYRRILEAAPSDVQALSGVATARFQQGDADEGTTFFARAFEANPFDPAPIRSTMNAFGDAGRLLGAIAFANLVRDKDLGEETSIFLDVLMLQLTKLLLREYPRASILDDADSVVARLVVRSASRPARVQVGVGRALVDINRIVEAAQIAERIAKQPLEDVDRGHLDYLEGLIHSAQGDAAAALASYLHAVEIDASRWEAATNAISILLERGDEASHAQIESILARVPASVKRTSPQLLLNEAVYFRAVGRHSDARTNLQIIVAGTRGEGDLGRLARQLLSEAQ